ncbi:cytochrome P450 [Aspergillus homomorphus CBS 101889]|uniref:Cytochrome P450 n=1 Tax=Aspergillus homomorphus (strain CBS 101889) TaxID=1450537 RepID=A0A395HXV0_ASPHC|nr:cytochrome P450 [Aspergillus homomorphus CBS 101889]RAL11688.1 cytochrome P450 [Aspergillus homomorphus CBS 101889]
MTSAGILQCLQSFHSLPSRLIVSICAIISRCIYRIYLHPLASIPRPKLAACTSLWLACHTYIGDECTVISELHRKHGPLLRVAPNDVDIADKDAVEPIYISRGGFLKTAAYSKFDIDKHTTIFSTASIRDSQKTEDRSPDRRPVNVLNLTRAMAIDAVSAYLFHQRYGALTEQTTSISASPFVDSYVGVGAFLNLKPGLVGDLCMAVVDRVMAMTHAHVEVSHSLIDQYTNSWMSATGMTTATILWYLAKQPETYARLRKAVQKSIVNGEDPMNWSSSWANPVRLPQTVPTGGWEFKGHYLPAGTGIGVAAFQLHQDSSVFPEPRRFLPERWENADEAMLTSFFAFGKGTRACIAQALAMVEVTMAISKVAEADLLPGATVVQDRTEIKEWFNSKVKGEEISIQFARN